MRFIRLLVVVVLVLSLVLNFILYNRTYGRRVQATVNGTPIRKKDFYDWMEMHYGPQTTAQMIRYDLVMQAAEKEHLTPDAKEIDERIKDQQERNPAFAREVTVHPWTLADYKQQAELLLALQNLATRDVKVTDDELKDFFNAQPGKWDVPDKIYTKAVQCLNDSVAAKVKDQMDRGVSDLTVLAGQYPGEAGPVGTDGTWVFVRPFGKPSPLSPVNTIAALKDGEVKVFPRGTLDAQFAVVIKREKLVPGKKVTLEEVKDKVARDYKATRATPPQEVLRKLWDEAKIETEDPTAKANVEKMLFPERAQMKQQAAAATP